MPLLPTINYRNCRNDQGRTLGSSATWLKREETLVSRRVCGLSPGGVDRNPKVYRFLTSEMTGKKSIFKDFHCTDSHVTDLQKGRNTHLLSDYCLTPCSSLYIMGCKY